MEKKGKKEISGKLMFNCFTDHIMTNLLSDSDHFRLNDPTILQTPVITVTLTSNQMKVRVGNWLLEVVWSILGTPYTFSTELVYVAVRM